jgi:hypothetical protein
LDLHNQIAKSGKHHRPKFVNYQAKQDKSASGNQIIVNLPKQAVKSSFADSHVFFKERGKHRNTNHTRNNPNKTKQNGFPRRKIKNRNGLKDIPKSILGRTVYKIRQNARYRVFTNRQRKENGRYERKRNDVYKIFQNIL